MKRRTRIAPSPTGIAHVGTAWMSLFDWGLAQQTDGAFVVRIEDTDRRRFIAEAESEIYRAFEWLGITYDEGGQKSGPHAPYHQSKRLDIYQNYATQLEEEGHLYPCFCSSDRLKEMRDTQQKNGTPPGYDGLCRALTQEEIIANKDAGESYVLRLKTPTAGTISWNDAIRGQISFDLAHIDDAVMIKSDGFPTYHFAVVIDDHLMEITHVLRGEEWISSGPKHLLLYRYLEWEPPIFAHMPLIRNADKSKLSKRKNDVSIMSYKEKGYLPEALVNFIVLLGWSHPEGKEIFSLEEFLKVVSLDRVQTTGPIFDTKKLDWMNGQYIRSLSKEELHTRLVPFLPRDFPLDQYHAIIPLVTERLVTLADVEGLTAFFYRTPEVPANLLLKRADGSLVAEQLKLLITTLDQVGTWEAAEIERRIRSLGETHNYHKKQFFMMIRVAVTGSTQTPPLFETMEVIGKQAVLERLQSAQQLAQAA
ncbi:MAG: glutamate--tRNA ligase [Pseudomonadales bacterium]|nr:glutamate--tRNA ligase [Candidatus Woesebacteria bacterium]MCB9802259.1 glutamate--tRNA ligase [Pseudomonadales bacterium]